MALGALSSLGAGSNGTLSYDIIDKLKSADINAMVSPVDRKISKTKDKENALDSITTLTATLKTTVVDLADDTFYEKRKVSVNGKDVSVKSNDGVATQDIEMTVSQLAKIDINQSKGFDSETSSVTDRDTSMTIDIDGNSYDIDVSAGTTLEELKDKINESTEGKVVASILNTGGNEPYSLILKSAETGANQAISVSYGDTDGDGTSNESPDDDFLDLTNVQSAQDAKFKFNGVDITRSTNEVTDLIVGVTFNLKGESGEKNSIFIKQDIEGIADMVEEFVSSYNSWRSKIEDVTKYDPDGKSTGVFMGDSTMRRLHLDVRYAVLNSEVDGKGLANYGMDISKDGIMSFKRDEFIKVFKDNPQEAVKVFTQEAGGVFSTLNSALKKATDPNNGYLKNYEDELKRDRDRLSEEREKTMQMLDARYEIMALQFAAYDEMISSMNISYQSLQMQIDTQLAKK